MFTGNLSPIAVGETYEEAIELRSEVDDTLISKTFLDACAKLVELFPPGCDAPVLTASVTVPSDGILIYNFGDTSSLRSGIHRVRCRLTKDGITDDVLDASLPVLP